MHFRSTCLALALAIAGTARAQAPAAGPLVLLLPGTARATAMGNAWVAGRDESSVFSNPAQINPTPGFGGTFARYGSGGTSAMIASATVLNWLTLGWGVEAVDFKARTDASYPFTPGDVARGGSRDAQSLLASAGGSFLVKKFRVGLGAKYAEDRVDGVPSLGAPSILKGVLLGDVGVAHPLLSGTAALAVQNFGDDSRIPLPIQTTLGWARQMQAQQLDLAFAAQVSERNRWIGAGGGVELGYGWIEGWSTALRAGLRRPETSAQRPVSLGAGLSADHLGVDYALELFEGSRYAHHFSLRWR
jgi:hypothetical protein